MSRCMAVRCSDTLFERFFPFVRFRITGNFYHLDSRFAKAGRRLGPVYMEVGVPRLVR